MSLKNERIVFTGTLATMTRKQAQSLVYSLGGKTQANVTSATTILVVGSLQGDLLEGEVCSKKMSYALELKKLGHPILLVKEKEFFSLIQDEFSLIVANL